MQGGPWSGSVPGELVGALLLAAVLPLPLVLDPPEPLGRALLHLPQPGRRRRLGLPRRALLLAAAVARRPRARVVAVVPLVRPRRPERAATLHDVCLSVGGASNRTRRRMEEPGDETKALCPGNQARNGAMDLLAQSRGLRPGQRFYSRRYDCAWNAEHVVVHA
jgi:hypothetical protein